MSDEGMSIRPMTEEDLEEMMKDHHQLNPDRPIKIDTKESLIRYRDHGIEPGGFLSAVLENDLMGALGRADSYNRATIFQITQFVYNDMPSISWGSRKIVKSYLDNFKVSSDGQ